MTMTTDARISVIIPAFNAARTIGRAVDSVLTQTCQAHEIIVVDDGSTDDLGSALRPCSGRITLVRTPNGGVSRARNSGLEVCTGDLVAFLDADDYWETDKLRRHAALYRQHPGLGLTFSDFWWQEPGDERRLRSGHRVDPSLAERPRRLAGRELFELALAISTITVVAPRALIGDLRFPTDLTTAEDRDMWARLLMAAPVAYLPEPLATVVMEHGSLSRSDVTADCQNMLRVVRRFADVLGPAGVRDHEAEVFRRWAGVLLDGNEPRAARTPAVERLRRQPWSLEGWWVLSKCIVRAFGRH